MAGLAGLLGTQGGCRRAAGCQLEVQVCKSPRPRLIVKAHARAPCCLHFLDPNLGARFECTTHLRYAARASRLRHDRLPNWDTGGPSIFEGGGSVVVRLIKVAYELHVRAGLALVKALAPQLPRLRIM